MAQPPAYNRSKDFTEDFGSETDHSALNAELDTAANSINDIRTNLAIMQADDGKLRPGVVTPDSISAALRTDLINGATAGAADAGVLATNKAAEAAASATLAATNGAEQVALAADQVALAITARDAAVGSATTGSAQAGIATTKAGEAAASAASVNRDGSGGVAGLTLFKINMRNALNTFTSFLTNSNTAARTYTFRDRDGTIADDTDLSLKLTKASNLWDLPSATVARTNLGATTVGNAVFVAADAAAARAALGVQSATETSAGIAELATQTETNTGTDDGKIVTALKLKTFINARVWQNFLPSRTKGVTYTNSTGRPIGVSVEATAVGSGAGVAVEVKIDGLSLGSNYSVPVSTQTPQVVRYFEVPDGATYVVVVSPGNLTRWVEWS